MIHRISPAGALLLLALTSPAQAEPVAVKAEGETRSVACTGGEAAVSGNRNTITFTGACAGLQLRGESNTISLRLAPGALIDIEGNRNRLHYTTTAGAPPRLRISGSGTEIAPMAGAQAPAADTATLSGDDQTLTLDCMERAMTLQGTRMTVTLLGACSALTIRGEASTVRADFAPGAQVLIEGNGITLSYTVHGGGAPPAFTVRGMGSTVALAGAAPAKTPNAVAPPANPASAPLASVPQLMSDLDGVVVAQGTLVKLPPAVFNADGLAPAGETQLGRLVSLIDQIHPTGLRIAAHDPAGADQAAKRLALARDWLGSHGLPGLPTEMATDTGPAGIDVLMLR